MSANDRENLRTRCVLIGTSARVLPLEPSKLAQKYVDIELHVGLFLEHIEILIVSRYIFFEFQALF